MSDIDGSGPSIRCKGYSRFAGYLRDDGKHPVFGEGVLKCSNGQELRGETVELAPGRGFGCLATQDGGRVMVVFGLGSHALAQTRDSFLSAYDSMVAESGLNRELCGWGLLTG